VVHIEIVISNIKLVFESRSAHVVTFLAKNETRIKKKKNRKKNRIKRKRKLKKKKEKKTPIFFLMLVLEVDAGIDTGIQPTSDLEIGKNLSIYQFRYVFDQ